MSAKTPGRPPGTPGKFLVPESGFLNLGTTVRETITPQTVAAVNKPFRVPNEDFSTLFAKVR